MSTGSSFSQRPQLKTWSDSVKNLWSYELTNQTIKERICINLSIEPKCQGDLQGHMIFYMTSKAHGPPRSLWPTCDAIWPKIREISAVESLMTSCMRDRKWRRKVFLRNKSHLHSAFTKISLISNRQLLTEIFKFKYIDDVIPLQPEVPFFNNNNWKFEVL